MTQTTTRTVEQTLSMIKPDAVGQNQIGNIIEYFEREGLSVAAAKMTRLSRETAEEFYAIHKGKSFFDELVEFISSGPVFVMILEGASAVATNRRIMGATDPAKAEPGTIRADFATSVDRNAVHGSDSLDNAKKEIAFFFQPEEIYTRTEI